MQNYVSLLQLEHNLKSVFFSIEDPVEGSCLDLIVNNSSLKVK